MRKATAPVLAATTLLGTVGILAGASPAAAATCSTVTIAGPAVNTLSVSSATVPVGGCVVFTNDALATVSVKVSGGFSSSSTDVSSLATSAPFTARSVGSETVSVAGTTLLLLHSSGTGSLTVTAAPKPTTSPASSPSHKPSGSSHSGSTSTKGGGSSATSGTSGKAGTTGKSGSAKKSGGGKISSLSSVPAVALPPFPHFPSREFTATRTKGSAPQIAGDPASPAPLPVDPTEATLPKPTQVQLADASSVVKGQNRALPITIAILMVLAVSTAYGRTVLRRPSAVDNGLGTPAGV